MPTFDYRADDAQGRHCKGRLEADSPSARSTAVTSERGLWPRDVSEIRVAAGMKSSLGTGRLSAADLALLTLQLSTLVQAGLPLEEALDAVAKQSAKRRVASPRSAVRSRVMEGRAATASRPGSPRPSPNCSAPRSLRVSAPVIWAMCWSNWLRIPRRVRPRGKRSRWPWSTRRF